METSWLAGALLHPVALVVLAAVVGFSSHILLGRTSPGLSRRQLLGGYAGIVLIGLIIAAVSSYVSPEEALRVWSVPPDRYWGALCSEFLTATVFVIYVSIFGTAVVGVPVIFWLARRRMATVPWVLLAAFVISVACGGLLLGISAAGIERVLRDVIYLTGMHLLLALGFCIGAQLPWTLRRQRGAA